MGMQSPVVPCIIPPLSISTSCQEAEFIFFPLECQQAYGLLWPRDCVGNNTVLENPGSTCFLCLEKAQMWLLQGKNPPRERFWRTRGYLEHSSSTKLPEECSFLRDPSLHQQETTTWAQTTYRILGNKTFLLLYSAKFLGDSFHSSRSLK